MKIKCNRCDKYILKCSSNFTNDMMYFHCKCGNVMEFSYDYIKEQDDKELKKLLKIRASILEIKNYIRNQISGWAEINSLYKPKVKVRF